jgi:hypothetical protein
MTKYEMLLKRLENTFKAFNSAESPEMKKVWYNNAEKIREMISTLTIEEASKPWDEIPIIKVEIDLVNGAHVVDSFSKGVKLLKLSDFEPCELKECKKYGLELDPLAFERFKKFYPLG